MSLSLYALRSIKSRFSANVQICERRDFETRIKMYSYKAFAIDIHKNSMYPTCNNNFKLSNTILVQQQLRRV